jgi:glycosyltransferase involved in cell wall biosynthesis
MVELHRMALFNFYTMLDTIAWDILFVAPRGLDATWEFLSAYADGILYISQYTRDRFATRFPSSATTPGYVSRLSVNPADYRVQAELDARPPGEPFLFIVGNKYDHKDVGPTVDALASAFPLLSIKALGLKNHANSHVECLESGRVQQADMDRLFAQAMALVFPSFYEGFGFPVLKGLSNGRTVIARHSELLLEVASRYRGPGRLIPFRNPTELIQAVTGVIQDSAIAELPLGNALTANAQPRDWKEVARGVLGFIEGQVQDLANCRWSARQKAIEQMDAYSGQR